MKRKVVIMVSLSIILGCFGIYRLLLKTDIIYQKNGISVYSFNIFGNNTLVRTDNGNLLKTTIITTTGEFLYPPEIINPQQPKWISIITKSHVELYSISRKSIYKFYPTDKFIVSGCISTIDKTKAYKLLLITSSDSGQYGNHLIVANISEGNNININTICEKQMKSMKPWKIQTGDVDGDGINEISIAMYKKTPFNPIMAKRPFLYEWIGSDIAPRWLGSRLSMPFDDFIFEDINNDGKDELISIETNEDNQKVLRAYAWKGFGFEALGSSNEYRRLTKLHRVETGPAKKFEAMVYKSGKFENEFFIYKDNKLEEYNNEE